MTDPLRHLTEAGRLGRFYIDGAWREPAGAERVGVVSPAEPTGIGIVHPAVTRSRARRAASRPRGPGTARAEWVRDLDRDMRYSERTNAGPPVSPGLCPHDAPRVRHGANRRAGGVRVVAEL